MRSHLLYHSQQSPRESTLSSIARRAATAATSLARLRASFRLRPCLRAGPGVFFHVYALAFDDDSFGLEQAPLKTCVRLPNQQASACANHPMPRDAFYRQGRPPSRIRQLVRRRAGGAPSRALRRLLRGHAEFFSPICKPDPKTALFAAPSSRMLISLKRCWLQLRFSEFPSRLLSLQIKHLSM